MTAETMLASQRTLRRLHQVVADLNASRDLKGTLQAVVDGAVAGLGYGLAAVNLVRPDGDLQVAAVAGRPGDHVHLTGQVCPRASWDALLKAADPRGPVLFLDRQDVAADVPSWIPDHAGGAYPDAWRPFDALLAPLTTPGGDLLGVLSVDLPEDGRRPGPWQCELLGLFAVQAAIAIDNARLRTDMQHALRRLESEQQALRASEESFRQAFEYAPSGMVMTGLQGPDRGRLLRANDALCRILGYPAPVLCRLGLAALAHPDDRDLLAGHVGVPGEPGTAELRLARSDGTYRWVSLRTSHVHDGSGRPCFVLTHVEDVEDRRRREEALVHQASHDPLTGLPNGRELRARLELRFSQRPHAAPAPAGDAKGLALLFCDLDGFKRVNDDFGHHIGDAVLVEVARRLAAAVREGDTVARLGGDEFVVLADGIGADEARDLAVRLRRALSVPIRAEGRTVPLGGASFGIGWAGEGSTPEDLLRAADARMYAHKRRRRAG